jgi:hypothetical protein
MYSLVTLAMKNGVSGDICGAVGDCDSGPALPSDESVAPFHSYDRMAESRLGCESFDELL